jgi:hypothetical protein
LILPILVVGLAVWWLYPQTQPHASDTPLTSSSDLSDVCSSGFAREYFPDAAAYRGPGPHTVEILEQQDSSAGGYYSSALLFAGPLDDPIPEHWRTADDPRAVQVVACSKRVDEAEQVKTCHFDSPEPKDVPMYLGTYEVILYEVRTGKEITRSTMPGDGTICPTYVTYLGEEPEVFTSLTLAQYRRVLGRHVDA